jgi:hypothetical protein
MPPSKSKDANAARRCGKAWKKNPGVNPSVNTGRTTDGYSPAALQRRAAKRAGAKTAALRDTSQLVATLAYRLEELLPAGPETTTGLRKLLEAKDCFVRAALDLPTKTKDEEQ